MSGTLVFDLTRAQKERLLALRAAAEEGEDEERLDRLRQREEDSEILQSIAALIADTKLAHGESLSRVRMAALLALVRALAPNPNLDSRLLRRAGEPEVFNRELHDLLYGAASVPVRLRQFLARRHVGAQTALQLLCAAFPAEWPLVTQAGLQTLELSPVQRTALREAARVRFDLPDSTRDLVDRADSAARDYVADSDPVLRLLADVMAFEAVRELLEAPDYVAVYRLLTGSQPQRSAETRSALDTARSAPLTTRIYAPQRPSYRAGSAESEAPAPTPPDLSGVLQRDLLTAIEREIADQGFSYPPLVIRDYYLCLQSRGRLTILSGLSGTGKSSLARLFADTLTSNLDTQYLLLPVRPDWADATPLLGYVNLLTGDGGRYVSTPFVEFLRRAGRRENIYRTFFVCLDEINLARIEHYFAEALSAMETPSREMLLPNGELLRLPTNLFITGTLNVDEGTYSLSRKVLDRANAILLNEVSLGEQAGVTLEPHSSTLPPTVRQALFLQRRVQTPAAAHTKLRAVSDQSLTSTSNTASRRKRKSKVEAPADEHSKDLVEVVIDTLAQANALLEPHDLHFAYRVRDEILIYCANSFDLDGIGLLVSDDIASNLRTALDMQLSRKVLPRLTGTQEQVEAPARDLLRWAQHAGYDRTARRLARLLARLKRDGFAGLE